MPRAPSRPGPARFLNAVAVSTSDHNRAAASAFRKGAGAVPNPQRSNAHISHLASVTSLAAKSLKQTSKRTPFTRWKTYCSHCSLCATKPRGAWSGYPVRVAHSQPSGSDYLTPPEPLLSTSNSFSITSTACLRAHRHELSHHLHLSIPATPISISVPLVDWPTFFLFLLSPLPRPARASSGSHPTRSLLISFRKTVREVSPVVPSSSCPSLSSTLIIKCLASVARRLVQITPVLPCPVLSGPPLSVPGPPSRFPLSPFSPSLLLFTFLSWSRHGTCRPRVLLLFFVGVRASSSSPSPAVDRQGIIMIAA
ncbi:hypothetical protein IWZ01DRAFT_45289 [Phyllosticta capitalensis]